MKYWVPPLNPDKNELHVIHTNNKTLMEIIEHCMKEEMFIPYLPELHLPKYIESTDKILFLNLHLSLEHQLIKLYHFEEMLLLNFNQIRMY